MDGSSSAPAKGSPYDPRRIDLTQGAYQAQSVIADAQRCVNLYPEQNPTDSVYPFTHYQTPGLTTRAQASNGGPVRCLYRASNGNLYAAIDQRVFYVTPTFDLVQLGVLTTQSSNPVSMKDNGVEMLIADGSMVLYSVILGTNQFSNLGTAGGTYQGADRLDYMDTFLLFNIIQSPSFGSTLSNNITIDPTYFAAKTGQPDTLQTIIVAHHEIWLLGERTTELWADAGNPLFPFAALPGVFIDHGCASKYSAAIANNAVFWLSEDDRGWGIVLKGLGYQSQRISTHALEQEFLTYPTLTDAIGFTYQQAGHTFYVLIFPSADKTWAYDDSTGFWHEWATTDTEGKLHRHRSNCQAFAYGKNLVGDYLNGTIYSLEAGSFTDAGAPIKRIRSFPTLTGSGRRVNYHLFVADMEVGEGVAVAGFTPKVSLRWSDTGGKSWGNYLEQLIGQGGQYATQLTWRRLAYSRSRVFELSWSIAAKTALNGAYVVGKASAT